MLLCETQRVRLARGTFEDGEGCLKEGIAEDSVRNPGGLSDRVDTCEAGWMGSEGGLLAKYKGVKGGVEATKTGCWTW